MPLPSTVDQQIRQRVVPPIRTTDGLIAVQNLHAQIDGLERQTQGHALSPGRRAHLVELLLLRGHLLGRIADYEHADALAEQLVRDTPTEAIAYVARARTGGTFHRFAESLADLDRAEQLGYDPILLLPDGASALHETGRSGDAFALLAAIPDRRHDVTTLGALAVLYAAYGETVRADETFTTARARYRGVSPFSIAMLDFQRGRMWLEHGEPGLARCWLAAARRRLPSYVPAQEHLAAAEAALGASDVPIARRSA
jgi:predicted Zn-dependent protease